MSHRRHLNAIGLLLLATVWGGCTTQLPPDHEWQTAHDALTQAQAANAPTLAPDTFQRAQQLLQQAEALISRKDYDEARMLLPQAEEQARLARADAEAKTLPPPPVELPAVAESVPAEPAAAPVVLPAPRVRPKSSPSPLLNSYTVASGDTLWSVAARPDIYGDPLLWPLLYQANRDQIKDPRAIFTGQQLTIPHSHTDAEREEARSKARKSDIFPVEQLLRTPRS